MTEKITTIQDQQRLLKAIEIANILNVTEATINFHRKNLREKFGLKNRPTGLHAYLISLN